MQRANLRRTSAGAYLNFLSFDIFALALVLNSLINGFFFEKVKEPEMGTHVSGMLPLL